ncbi:MAG: hypothetical protein ACYS8W_14485 [Planctomycetota bacterium]|jgi:hypothetical protein
MRYLGLIIVGIIVIVANVAVVLVYKYERRPRKSECKKNLEEIVRLMIDKDTQAWKLDRSAGDFHKKLLELFKEDSAINKLKKHSVCPFCRDRDTQGGFSYAGPFIPEKFRIRVKDDEDMPVLWDKLDNHPDGVHVAYLRYNQDVIVEFLSKAEFAKLMTEISDKIEK